MESGIWQALSFIIPSAYAGVEDAVGQAVLNLKDPALIILVCALAGLGWLHVLTIRENRQDRQALMDLLQKNTEAINGLKNVLSARTGQVL